MLALIISIFLSLLSPMSSSLKADIEKLSDALTKRDLPTLRSEISSARIFVEIDGREGAYLSNSQTVVVLENFMRSRRAIQTRFDLITDNGQSGSATGILTAKVGGRVLSYKLNLGFILIENKRWVIMRLSIRS
jgi:hypothetical protein